MRNNTLVSPTGIVTPSAALTQLVPLKYSNSADVPVSVPTIPPIPFANVGVNTTGKSAAGTLSVTSTTAYGDPSFTITLEIDITGASKIVTVPETPIALTKAVVPVIAPVSTK